MIFQVIRTRVFLGKSVEDDHVWIGQDPFIHGSNLIIIQKSIQFIHHIPLID